MGAADKTASPPLAPQLAPITGRERAELTFGVQMLQAAYARSIDNNLLEEWPDFFTEACLYKVISEENMARRLPLGMIYADTRGMLRDRVLSLREANIYEPQRYRHVLGTPVLLGRGEDGTLDADTGFVVVRTMRDGASVLFASGRYLDRVEAAADGSMLFRQKIVVCDSSSVDTLLALPI